MQSTPITIQASDGYSLHGRIFAAKPDSAVLLVGSATAVPQRYYASFASDMQSRELTVITFDYRGIGESAPSSLRGFEAGAADWGLKDLQAAVDYIDASLSPPEIFVIGHSAGGQQAGLITGPERISSMVTVSAQSGYWRLQGGHEKLKVLFAATVLMPGLTRIFGYFPWSKLGGEDLPYGVAMEWAAWCRSPGYLLDDKTLPLERFDSFTAPILAYSIDDDGWGTEQSVRSMMSAYPNVSFEHIVPGEHGLTKMGHFGFFRESSRHLWDDVYDWFRSHG